MRYSALQHPSDARSLGSSSGATPALPWLTLRDQDADSQVVLAPGRGALTRSFSVAGHELLYLDETTFADLGKNVRGGIPVLFPSPGRLHEDRWQRDGKHGLLPQHGFARNDRWQLLALSTTDAASAELELVQQPHRFAQYPWRFRLVLKYQLVATTLRIESSVTNLDDHPLPYALGFHPYFAVQDKADVRITTNASKAYDNVHKRIVELSELELQSELRAGGELDLHLLDHSLATCGLQFADGGAIVLRASPAFARWVIWTSGDRPFVCVEPWTAEANALNTGQLLSLVAPGTTHTEWMEICWREASLPPGREHRQAL